VRRRQYGLLPFFPLARDLSAGQTAMSFPLQHNIRWPTDPRADAVGETPMQEAMRIYKGHHASLQCTCTFMYIRKLSKKTYNKRESLRMLISFLVVHSVQ
jgi:hypothetical protein